MKTLIEQYNQLLDRINSVNELVRREESALAALGQDKAKGIPARIEELEAQIKKIDEMVPDIVKLQEFSRKFLKSLAITTIDTPPNYRVNIKRLKAWAECVNPYSIIDVESEGQETLEDPYARRIYVATCNDLQFLEKKRRDYEKTICALKDEAARISTEEFEQHKQRMAQLEAELCEIAASREMAEFANNVVNANSEYSYEVCPEKYAPGEFASPIAPGAYDLPLPMPNDSKVRESLKALFGNYYDAKSSRVLLPFEIFPDKEFAIKINCTTAKTKKMDRGIQNLILSIIDRTPAGHNKVYFLDSTRYNTAGLGTLRMLEGSFALGDVPRNSEQMTATLEDVVASFDDKEEILGYSDSVIEYNASVSSAKKLSRTTIVLVGWPKAFSQRDNELIRRIMTNYERYGVSFVAVVFNRNNDKDTKFELPEYADQNAIHIDVTPEGSFIAKGDGNRYNFSWYGIKSEMPDSYNESLRERKVDQNKTGNDYTKRHSLEHMPEYGRYYKPIVLPYGIDAKDQEHSISFENENFAAFLMGASRSGKSTLIHTLILGIISNYHPDNVELWLADFKQLEFRKYIEHCPPHVKYILLDESPELVYDLIDKLTEKMLERQRLLSKYHISKLSEKPDTTEFSEPMPVIFVILDEFSIMSQAVAESQIYRLRLQNLLAKGAALGIRFLFASQTFTNGVNGLTPTARAQIQQRIAMKGKRDEITETLELSAEDKKEHVVNWMNSLPPHYALVKYMEKLKNKEEFTTTVTRVLVEYIPEEKEDDRNAFIDMLNKKLKKSDTYICDDINHYVDKHPVLVDGNSYTVYDSQKVDELINGLKQDPNMTGDETFAVLGTPRLMASDKPIVISPESRENILLINHMGEQICAASIITSVMKSFAAQGKKVHVWAYGRNSLYRTYKTTAWNIEELADVNYVENIDAVCDEIYKISQKMKSHESGDDLIVMLGMDRICGDFEFGGALNSSGGDAAEQIREAVAEREKATAAATVKTEAESQQQLIAVELGKLKREIKDKAKQESWSKEKLDDELNKAKTEFFAEARKRLAEMQQNQETEARTADKPVQDKPKKKEEHQTGAYNAAEDFKYIVRLGSRMGYHFFLNLNDFSDLKGMGLKVNSFRHRLAFQISKDDSTDIFGNKVASELPERICEYSDTISKCSFRPYLHENITWDGWVIDENGKAVSPFASIEENKNN